MEPGPRVPSPRESVFHLMRIALQEHTARWGGALTAADLPDCTKQQYAALRAVQAHPGLDQASVGQFTGTDKATLAVLLGKLAQRGLLTRDVDPDDRRRRLLHLTDQGRALLATLVPVVEALSAEMLDRLTESERRDLAVLLGKLSGLPRVND